MTRYKAAPGVILTSVCDRYYLVTVRETLQVNETAALCWRKLEEGTEERELTSLIKDHYEMEETGQIEKDIHDLTEILLEKNMLVRCAD